MVCTVCRYCTWYLYRVSQKYVLLRSVIRETFGCPCLFCPVNVGPLPDGTFTRVTNCAKNSDISDKFSFKRVMEHVIRMARKYPYFLLKFVMLVTLKVPSGFPHPPSKKVGASVGLVGTPDCTVGVYMRIILHIWLPLTPPLLVLLHPSR